MSILVTEDELRRRKSPALISISREPGSRNSKVLVKASSGLRYVVGCRNEVDKETSTVGTRVVLDMTTLTIMRALPPEKSQHYNDVMQKVEALQKVLEDNPEYPLILDYNTLSVDIENEINIIHNFIRDKYRLKFPELESLVHHPIEYARVVKQIENESDLSLVDLEGLLPSAIIMAVSVSASTTSWKPLPEDVLQKTVEACDRVLDLDSTRKKILDFKESRMVYIAPCLD